MNFMNNEENKKDEQLNPLASSGQVTPTAEVSELDKLKEERDEYLNGWKRAKADLINYQKDESKRLRDAMSYGAEAVMRDLILVLDSFALAATAGKEDEGTKAIRNQLSDALKRQGLEKMKVSPGDAFDPNLHESLGEMEIELPPGTIAVEVEAGYLLHGKVVRPARVKLAK